MNYIIVNYNMLIGLVNDLDSSIAVNDLDSSILLLTIIAFNNNLLISLVYRKTCFVYCEI